MFEIRCPNCHNLLAKEEIRNGVVEIKCSHCNTYVKVDRLNIPQKENLPLDRSIKK